MSLKINDERPVLVKSRSGPITSAADLALALGVEVDRVHLISAVYGGNVIAFCYLGKEWTVTANLDSEGSIELDDGTSISGPTTGQAIPTSIIKSIIFNGDI